MLLTACSETNVAEKEDVQETEVKEQLKGWNNISQFVGKESEKQIHLLYLME